MRENFIIFSGMDLGCSLTIAPTMLTQQTQLRTQVSHGDHDYLYPSSSIKKEASLTDVDHIFYSHQIWQVEDTYKIHHIA